MRAPFVYAILCTFSPTELESGKIDYRFGVKETCKSETICRICSGMCLSLTNSAHRTQQPNARLSRPKVIVILPIPKSDNDSPQCQRSKSGSFRSLYPQRHRGRLEGSEMLSRRTSVNQSPSPAVITSRRSANCGRSVGVNS